MDKKLINKINNLEIGEALNIKIKCERIDDYGCTHCIFCTELCNRIDCRRDEKERKYIIEL